MQNMRAVQVHQVESEPDPATSMHNLVGQFAPTSRKTSLPDARHFARRMTGYALPPVVLFRDDLSTDHEALSKAERYASQECG